MRISVVYSIAPVSLTASVSAQAPSAPAIVDAAGVTVLRGLTVHEFEAEMQLMTQALGLSCGSCHVRGNFASDGNPRRAAARRMFEMTRKINQQFFQTTSLRKASPAWERSHVLRATRDRTARNPRLGRTAESRGRSRNVVSGLSQALKGDTTYVYARTFMPARK